MNKEKSKMFMFVHLGSEIPLYLLRNIEWIKANFVDSSIIMVFDELKHRGRFSNLGVEEFLYVREQDTKDLLDQLKHDLTFRKGFWQLTIDRLFAICDAVIHFAASQVIYIESDVILLPNFPVAELQKLEKLAWARYNNTRDVPSVIFVPDADKAKIMRSELISLFQSNPNLTDMTALNILASKRQDLIQLLPTVVTGIENPKLLDSIEFSRVNSPVTQLKSQSQGIFDGATIGMFLTGQDPRNSYGFTLYLNPDLLNPNESYIDLTGTEFVISDRRLFILTRHRELIEIFNLHVHSKNIDMFTEKIFVMIQQMIIRANLGRSYSHFNTKIFLDLLVENARNKTLIIYLARIPRFVMNRLTEYLRNPEIDRGL